MLNFTILAVAFNRLQASVARSPRSSVNFLISGEALLGRLQRRESAPFLLDQVILHAAFTFSGLENRLPRRIAFAEKDAITPIAASAPVLQVQAIHAPSI